MRQRKREKVRLMVWTSHLGYTNMTHVLVLIMSLIHLPTSSSVNEVIKATLVGMFPVTSLSSVIDIIHCHQHQKWITWQYQGQDQDNRANDDILPYQLLLLPWAWCIGLRCWSNEVLCPPLGHVEYQIHSAASNVIMDISKASSVGRDPVSPLSILMDEDEIGKLSWDHGVKNQSECTHLASCGPFILTDYPTRGNQHTQIYGSQSTQFQLFQLQIGSADLHVSSSSPACVVSSNKARTYLSRKILPLVVMVSTVGLVLAIHLRVSTLSTLDRELSIKEWR